MATNLVAGDTNGVDDVFVHARSSGRTERVSVSRGRQANGLSDWPSVSADGRFVAFQSVATNLVLRDTNGAQDIFVHDRQTGATARVRVDSAGAQSDGPSTDPAINGDGTVVAFFSAATNLVPNDTNTCGVFPNPGQCPDIFVHVG